MVRRAVTFRFQTRIRKVNAPWKRRSGAASGSLSQPAVTGAIEVFDGNLQRVLELRILGLAESLARRSAVSGAHNCVVTFSDTMNLMGA
jgi:hypothetical protein